MPERSETFATELARKVQEHEKQLLRYQAFLAGKPPAGALSGIYRMTEHLLMLELSEGRILAEAQALLDSGEPEAELKALLHWCTHGPAAQGIPHPAQESFH